MALPEDSRPPLFKERAGRIHELYELLHLVTKDDISFIQLLTVRKGTKLVARTIPFLAKVKSSSSIVKSLALLPMLNALTPYHMVFRQGTCKYMGFDHSTVFRMQPPFICMTQVSYLLCRLLIFMT